MAEEHGPRQFRVPVLGGPRDGEELFYTKGWDHVCVADKDKFPSVLDFDPLSVQGIRSNYLFFYRPFFVYKKGISHLVYVPSSVNDAEVPAMFGGLDAIYERGSVV